MTYTITCGGAATTYSANAYSDLGAESDGGAECPVYRRPQRLSGGHQTLSSSGLASSKLSVELIRP
jgi:hypothetical protein